MELHQQLIRYVTLMLRPGLVTPTSDERCMQLAFVAKLNSGCISRQVGAAITDSSFSIKAVGWNDVPRGQVPCLLRDATALLTTTDEVAFSDYESKDRTFRAHMTENFKNSVALRTSTGLSCPYCFKDAYNAVTGDKNQVHTRSLHAEENAFLQLAKHGNSGIEGGQLYTTASPCELCSKKAFQLGIKEIIYVDPYPGISSKHILAAGIKSLRPSLRLFGGAVGNAYHRLYEAVLPIKDEFAARLRDDPSPPRGLF
jgi:deoxycytidylate deaminase